MTVSMNIQGVHLTNANLIQSNWLENQMLMVLELLADHAGQIEGSKKAIVKIESNVTGLQGALKQTRDDLQKTNDEVAKVDTYVKRAESKLENSISAVKKDVDRVAATTAQLSERLTGLENDVQPRLAKVEETLRNQAAELEKKISAIYTVIEENKLEADEKISDLDTRQKNTRFKLDDLERRFNEADIDGLRSQINELDVKVVGLGAQVDENEKRTEVLEETTEVLGGQIKAARNDLKQALEVTLPKTYATKEDVQVLKDLMREVVTKKELAEKLDDLHALINTFVFGELGKQRQEIYQKISVVQERLTSEIEEVARGEEIQMCVDRVQQFVHDIEDIGVAVAQHNDAIERAAASLAGPLEIENQLTRILQVHIVCKIADRCQCGRNGV